MIQSLSPANTVPPSVYKWSIQMSWPKLVNMVVKPQIWYVHTGQAPHYMHFGSYDLSDELTCQNHNSQEAIYTIFYMDTLPYIY